MKEFKISLNDEEIIELKKMFHTDNADEAVRIKLLKSKPMISSWL
jgi:hypothetical protein